MNNSKVDNVVRGLPGLPGPRTIPGVRPLPPAELAADEGRCPTWCRTTAEQHAREGAGGHLHEGPVFGLLRTWLLDNGTATFVATLPTDADEQPGLNAAALRTLADEALAAARWIEQETDAARASSGPSIADLVTRAHKAHKPSTKSSKPAKGA